MLRADHDLDCRDRRHRHRDATARPSTRDGIDGAPRGSLVEAGGRAGRSCTTSRPGRPGDGALELIALAAAPTRSGCRVVVETTTLDIEAGRPAIDHVEAALAPAAMS